MFSTQHQDITDWQEATLPFIHAPPPPPPPPHTSEFNNLDSTHNYGFDNDNHNANETRHIGLTLSPILPLQPSSNNNNQQSSSSTQPPPLGGGGGGGGVKPPKTSSSSSSLTQRTQPRIPTFNENLVAQQLVSTLTGGPASAKKKGGGGGGGGGAASCIKNICTTDGSTGAKAPRNSGVDITTTTTYNNNSNAIHRGLLLLRLPKPAQKHFDRLPAAVCDPSGQPCLLILPSDKPAGRQEAVAVEQFVSRSMGTPSRAAETAALWRRKMLSEKCGAAMTTLRQDSPAGWFVKRHQDDGANNNGGNTIAATNNSSCQKRGSSIGRNSITETSTTVGNNSLQKKTKTAGTSHLDTISEVSITTTTSGTTSGTLTPFSPLGSTKAPSLLSTTPSRLSSLGSNTGTALLGNGTASTSMPIITTMGWAGTCRGSMTAALTVAMAEVVRQVEVSCAERARVLIKLWNAMLEVTDGAMKEGIEAEGVRVMRENAVLIAEVATLRGDVRDVNELQLQVARLEKEVEELRRREREREREECDDYDGDGVINNIVLPPIPNKTDHIIDDTLGLIDFLD